MPQRGPLLRFYFPRYFQMSSVAFPLSLSREPHFFYSPISPIFVTVSISSSSPRGFLISMRLTCRGFAGTSLLPYRSFSSRLFPCAILPCHGIFADLFFPEFSHVGACYLSGFLFAPFLLIAACCSMHHYLDPRPVTLPPISGIISYHCFYFRHCPSAMSLPPSYQIGCPAFFPSFRFVPSPFLLCPIVWWGLFFPGNLTPVALSASHSLPRLATESFFFSQTACTSFLF